MRKLNHKKAFKASLCCLAAVLVGCIIGLAALFVGSHENAFAEIFVPSPAPIAADTTLSDKSDFEITASKTIDIINSDNGGVSPQSYSNVLTGLSSAGQTKVNSAVGLIINIPGDVEVIDMGAFKSKFTRNGLSVTVNIPASVKIINAEAFSGNTRLAQVNFTAGNNLKEICGYGAYGASKTTKSGAFYGCNILEEITLPDSLEKMGTAVFEGCTNLAEITVPFTGASFEPSGNQDDSLGYIFSRSRTSWTGSTSASYYNANGYSNNYFYVPTKLTKVTVTGSATKSQNIHPGGLSGFLNLQEVVLPEKATKIEAATFYNCRGLRSNDTTPLTIPSTVKEIGDSAFYYCNNTEFKKLQLPDEVELGKGVFNYCSNLETINFPDNITEFKESLFANCAKLNITSLPDTLTTLGDSALSGCAKLNISSLPVSLKTIGKSAFYGCSSLAPENLDLTKITSIGTNAFYNCTKLTSVTLPTDGGIVELPDGVFRGTGLISVEIPQNITKICTYAFGESKQLESVTFTDASKLETLEAQAFYNCTALSKFNSQTAGEFKIPSQVEFGYDRTFYSTACQTLTFDEGRTEVKDGGSYGAFNNCTKLTTVKLPVSLQNLGQYTFYNCSGIKTVNFAELTNLQKIGPYAFYGCSSLNGLDIAELTALKTIDTYAFYNCSKLQQVTVPASVTSFKEGKAYGVFSNCSGITDLTFKCEFGDILAQNMFSGCTNLTNLTFEKDFNVKTIGSSAFQGCAHLTEFKIPSNVTEIQNSAFNDCTSLTLQDLGDGKYLPEGLATLGTHVFRNTAITAINIPANITVIPKNSFSGCTELSAVTIESSEISKIDDYAFNGCSSLITLEIGIKSRATIGTYAFQNCGLQTLTFNGGAILSVGNYAFDTCTDLSSLTIPFENTTDVTIGRYAFQSCSSLEEFTLPANIQYIDSYVFHNCTALRTVTYDGGSKEENKYVFPESLTRLCNNSFQNSGAVEVTIHTNMNYASSGSYSSWDYYVFEGCKNLTTVHWLSPLIKTIPSYVFQNCSSLETFELPASSLVDNIDQYAFDGCTALKSFPFENIKSSSFKINSYAFRNCGFEKLELSDNVNSIGQGAFDGCNNIESVKLPFVGTSKTTVSGYAATLAYIFGSGNGANVYYLNGSSLTYRTTFNLN